MTPEIAARLESCEIVLAGQARDYCLFVRGECVALVQTADGRFLSLGSSGLMTENGLSYLVWVDGKAMLSSHGNQMEAGADQVEAIRRFSEDLKKIIWPKIQ